jgi:hypothetical protein
MPSTRLASRIVEAGRVAQSRCQIGEVTMFFFFSNRLGCFGSLVLSVLVTFLLILLLNR